MTVDNEAQKKTADELRVLFGSGYTDDEYLASARLLLSRLEDLGYRRLPKDKPPLLGDKDIKPFLKSKYPHMYRGHDEAWCRGRESALLVLLHNFDTELLLDAQRGADINHYEG